MTTIEIRRGTAAAWASADPILASGEPGLETDTLKEKIGDGVSPWNNLPYKPAMSDVSKAPDHAGIRRGSWDPVLSLYNGEYLFRKSMNAHGQAMAKTGLEYVVLCGDSIAQGYTVKRQLSWLDQLASDRGISEFISASAYGGGPGDDRIVYTGTWDQSQNTASNGSDNTDVATVTFTVPGRYIDIKWMRNLAANFTYQVDGGAAVNVTDATVDYSLQNVTVDTGSVGMHTVTVSGAVSFVGAGVRKDVGTTYLDNHAISGTDSSNWIGAPSYMSAPIVAMANQGGCVWVNLGTNDVAHGITREQFRSNMQSFINQFAPWVDVGLIVAHKNAVADLAEWKARASILYDLADANQCPLVDMLHHLSDNPDSGILSDGSHQNVSGHQLWKRNFAKVWDH